MSSLKPGAGRLLGVLLPAWMALAIPVLGQTDRTGIIEGRILDEYGSPVDGAVVRATWPDGSFPREAVAQETGAFRVALLPPGTYTLTVQAVGFGEEDIEGIQVNAGRATELDVRIAHESALTETVRVRAERPLIDMSTSEYPTILDPEATEILPYSRDAVSLIQFVPGARPDQVWGGSTEQANLYQLDGVNVNDPGYGGKFLWPNVDWIQEFQVRGLGAGAEYGNFQGGLVNIVTKSGSNTFTGAVRFNYESASLNASNINVQEVGSEPDRRIEFNASVGGPMIKNKLYYFFSVQEVGTDFRVVDASSTTSEDVVFLDERKEYTERKLLAKLTWEARSKDAFDFMFGVDNLDVDNDGLNSIDDPAALWQSDSPATFWNASWRRIFGPRGFLEVKVTGWDGGENILPKHGDLPGVVLLGGNYKGYRNAPWIIEAFRRTDAVAASWDSFWNTGGLSHHLKVGAEYGAGTLDERYTRTGGITWRPTYGPGGEEAFDPEDPATWGIIFSEWNGQIRTDAAIADAAVYAQDYLTVRPSLRLDFGLRFGHWEGDLKPGFGDGPEFNALSATAIDPRIGVTWNVAGEGRWVVKSHWGRYHQHLFALMFDRAEGGNVYEDLEYWYWVGDDENPLPDPNRRYTEEEREQLFGFWGRYPTGQKNGPVVDYDQPYVDQFVLGLERVIGESSRVGLVYLRRDSREILSLVDRNLDSNYTAIESVAVFENDDGAPGDPVIDQNGEALVLPRLLISNEDILWVGSAPGLTPEEVSSLDFEPDYVLTNVPDARREMDQFQLTWVRQGPTLWWNGSLVYTDLTGNFFTVSGYYAPAYGAGPYVDANEMINFSGNMPNYSRWEAKLSLGAQLPWGLRLGTFLLYRSGDYFAPRYVIDRLSHVFVSSDGEQLDSDLLSGVDGQGIFLESRGSREHEDFSTVDLHLDRPFRLGNRMALTLGLDVFNLLNNDSVVAVRTSVNGQNPGDPTTLFGAPRLRQEPRSLRLTTIFSW